MDLIVSYTRAQAFDWAEDHGMEHRTDFSIFRTGGPRQPFHGFRMGAGDKVYWLPKWCRDDVDRQEVLDCILPMVGPDTEMVNVLEDSSDGV